MARFSSSAAQEPSGRTPRKAGKHLAPRHATPRPKRSAAAAPQAGQQRRARRSQPAKRRRWPAVLAGLLGIALVAGFVAWALQDRGRVIGQAQERAEVPGLVEGSAPQQEARPTLHSAELDADGDGVVDPVPWICDSVTVAHAGGSYREGDKTTTYTNSAATLIQNYELGQRTFEYDFSLTSDGDLACLHNWENNTPLTRDEWLSQSVSTSGGNKLATMVVGDLYDTMLGLPNMIMVADTKAPVYKDDEQVTIYRRLAEAARERSPALLGRILPYVYSAHGYELARKAYPWPKVIYAAYADTSEPAEQVLSFVLEHDDVVGVCAHFADARFGKEALERLHAKGKLMYVYTVNEVKQARELMAAGDDVMITDVLLPSDLA